MNSSDTKSLLIANSNENRQLLQNEDKCDKYDYLIAVGCGAIGGIVDIFLVGTPADSRLAKWSDKQVDNAVMKFAKMCGWAPKDKKVGNVASAIGYLENGNSKFKGFRVNYDQRYSSDVGGLFDMSTKDHHMKSLAHSPDIIGLFFSVLNQFTSTSSFVADGRLITIKTDTFELEGGNFIAKIFSGIVNWFGHIMSDIAGSSGSRGNDGHGRGTGVVMPFYELFQFFDFGKFDTGKDKYSLAQIATEAFKQGYDFRFATTMAIPVIITDLSIRVIWSLRRYFQYGNTFKDCIPTSKHKDLRLMLLLGNGTLCVMDGVDAGIRSGGNFLEFFMRLNIIAWFRFIILVLKEVCIRLGIKDAMQKNLEAFKRVNEELLVYLKELEKIDIKAFRIETEKYNQVIKTFTTAKTDEELNSMLLDAFEKLGINKPWKGDFDAHMSNKNATLKFE